MNKSFPGWVIIKAEEKRMIGGIELPDSAKTETQSGTVVSIPDSKEYVEGGVIVSLPDISIGDMVAFRKYHSSEIEIEGEKYQSVHAENIIIKL